MKEYLLAFDEAQFRKLIAENSFSEAFEILAEPLHEWLYNIQDFEAIHTRTSLEQLILCFDYVRIQVSQGGFIQLIQNQYTPLLVTVIEQLQELKIDPAMAQILDDVLKVYVLNVKALSSETSTDEFAKLYDEFKEFELLETRFNNELGAVLRSICLREY